MQEDHDFADGPLLGPTRGDAIGALRTNAGNFPQPMRLCFDDVEYLAAEGPDEFAGISRTNATDHSGAEIFFDALCRGGRHRSPRRFHVASMGLSPAFRMRCFSLAKACSIGFRSGE
jgi:hypothetical protein